MANPPLSPPPNPPEILLPDAPALVAGVRGAYIVEPTGEVLTLGFGAAAKKIRAAAAPPPIVCHARRTGQRLGVETLRGYDVLELYAFALPGTFCLPTPSGLAQALGLTLPRSHEAEAMTLVEAARALLERVMHVGASDARTMVGLARAMAAGGWPWAVAGLAALGEPAPNDAPHSQNLRRAFRVWDRLPDWEDRGFEAKPGDAPVSPQESRQRLAEMLASRTSEERPQQQKFAAGVASAFDPCEEPGQPRFVLAEAGTGVGKTLGYVAPASVWADKNGGAVWLSTYTRNLQRQLDDELDRLYPDPVEKKRRVVVRKGRENYFCLLNFEEALGRMETRPGGAIALGLVARWAGATRDGDMVGGDFPAWLPDMLGRGLARELTDTKGECTYSACPHFGKCFIEHSKRRAKRAKLVIANHALVMVQAALGAGGSLAAEGGVPTRYVFDEGHHLFDAADSAFAAHLSGYETGDLRRWILGSEESQSRRTRSRGLKKRLEDLSATDEKLSHLVDDVRQAASVLPGPGWQSRLADEQPYGPAEAFLAKVRQQVYARDRDSANSGYSLECPATDPVDGLLDTAHALDQALMGLERPVRALIKRMLKKLDDEADELESSERTRIEGLAGSLERRAALPVQAWRAMLGSSDAVTPDDFVDWFSVERIQGKDWDMGLNRHWVDPTQPFAASMRETAEGILVTSATLRDGIRTEDANEDTSDWTSANARTGANHIGAPVGYVAQPSPFDYAQQTRIFVITDVNKNSTEQVAAAYRELFLAANGGGLGLFTAISRLRGVFERIAPQLDEQGYPLYAQHVDSLDVGTLVDIFRAEENACLLGTDAVRDGVDVPGRSLRLIVFDRVPWPRPDILTRARRERFGGRAYDEMLARLKLKQAYGRLVRKKDDRGVFVMLDSALPTRLTSAFPKGVEVVRLGLKDAISEVRAFLADNA